MNKEKLRGKIFKVIAISMTMVLLSGCHKEEEELVETKIVNVEVIKPVRDTISVDGTFVGTVETGNVVSVYPKINAQVMAKYYEVGDYVNEGDLLFVLDDKALQIEKKNADASVKSAAAALDAQKASSAAAQAAANETIGTIATTEYERNKALKDAEREEETAKLNENKNKQQAGIYNEDADRAKKQRDRAKDQLKDAERYYDKLNKIKKEYIRYEKEGNTEGAEEVIANSKFLSYEELNSAIEAAKGVVESATAEKNSQEGNYSTSISQKLEASVNAEIEKGTLASAKEAKALAQKMLEDFEIFTKNTIIAEANAKVAEGQSNVAASDSLLQSARATQDLANLQLSYTTVMAPISGVIDEINVVQFGMATDQSPAYVITGENSKKIVFGVPENIKNKIGTGQPVTILKDDREYTAVVTGIKDNLKQDSMLFNVEAAIKDSEDSMFAVGTKLKIITGIDKKENVLTLPISALYYDDGHPYIYVAENGKAIRKDIETGISDNYKIQVVSGLDENSQIIISWSSALKDQTDIKIVDKNTNESITKKIETGKTGIKDTKKIDISRNNNSMEGKNYSSNAKTVETIDKVNIRKEADKNSEKLGTVVKGTVLEMVCESDNGWTKIRYNGQEAYIKSEYIRVIQ